MAPELRQKGHDSFEHTASTAEVWPEPPPGQEGAMSIARPLKPRRLSFSGSTASGSGSLSLDDLATPQTTGGLDESLEGDLRMYGHPLGILDPLPGSGSSRGTAPPRAPAPTMPAMTAPPPPSYDVSLGRPEKPRRPGPCPLSELLPAPAAYASWPVTPASIPPASVPPTPSRGVPPVPVLSSGPPTPSGAAALAPFADASQRGLHRPELHSTTSEEDALLVQALSLLHSLLSGPIVPDLPPSGCYGGLKVSKAISEALGAEASKVQAAAVEGHGENPVKVLLPQYPIHPNLLSIDHTQPAKLQDPEAPDEVELELAKPPSPYGYMPNYPGPGMAPPSLMRGYLEASAFALPGRAPHGASDARHPALGCSSRTGSRSQMVESSCCGSCRRKSTAEVAEIRNIDAGTCHIIMVDCQTHHQLHAMGIN